MRASQQLSIANAREHSLHMRDRCLRQDAMPKIEDERTTGKCGENLVYAAVERLTARQQEQWIEIALQRNAWWNLRARRREIDRPIKRDGINFHFPNIGIDAQPCSARKSNHSRIRNFGPYLCKKAMRWLDAPAMKFGSG